MGFKSVLATSYHICAIKTPEGCLVLLKPSERPQREGEIPSLEDGGENSPPQAPAELWTWSAPRRGRSCEKVTGLEMPAGDPSVP